MSRARPYVGRCLNQKGFVVFRATSLPTEKDFGALYAYVIGPFKTVRGASFMAQYGHENPHCVTVAQAEKLAARLAARLPDPRPT